MKFQLLDANGDTLDAHFSVEENNLVFHSRGGTKGTSSQTNADYSAGLRRLLYQVKKSNLAIEGIWVDSSVAQDLPIDERSIWSPSDDVVSAEELAATIAKRMKDVGRQPSARPRGGNATKKIRIALNRPLILEEATKLLSARQVSDEPVGLNSRQRITDATPPNADWTDRDNDLIVADYFEMLSEEITGRKYNKSVHRRALLPKLGNKSNGSIEFKHQNVSAVLQHLGLPWIKGYKPRHNFQGSLVDAVERWVNDNPGWKDLLLAQEGKGTDIGPQRLLGLEPSPEAPAKLQPEAEERIKSAMCKIDFAGLDEKNRELGLAGEQLVLELEKTSLRNAGRSDLAGLVRHVSVEDGDGAGYDIASFYPDGSKRLVEVKTTNGGERTAFFISSNELAVAEDNFNTWVLVRVWNFSREPRAFELRPPIEDRVQLVPTTYRASFG